MRPKSIEVPTNAHDEQHYRSIEYVRRSQDSREARNFKDRHESNPIPPSKTAFGRSMNSLYTHLADSSIELFTRLPDDSTWIKNGLVERQTSATHVPWQNRHMILTPNCIIFSKPGSDTAMDTIPLSNISLVGTVEGEEERSLNKTLNSRKSTPAIASQYKRRRKAAAILGSGSDLEAKGQRFTFEIVTKTEGRDRSYFCRVDTIQLCEEWVTSIERARAAVLGVTERRRRSAISWCQVPYSTCIWLLRAVATLRARTFRYPESR